MRRAPLDKRRKGLRKNRTIEAEDLRARRSKGFPNQESTTCELEHFCKLLILREPKSISDRLLTEALGQVSVDAEAATIEILAARIGLSAHFGVCLVSVSIEHGRDCRDRIDVIDCG